MLPFLRMLSAIAALHVPYGT